MANEEIKILINAEDKASGVFNKLQGSSSSLGSALGGMAKVAGVAVVAGFGAMVAGAFESVSAFAESENAVTQLEAALKSTGGASGLFVEDLQDQASALQRLTKYTDESVMSAQGLLLTFTSVKGPVFQEAIGTILDMSTALGQDLKSSAIQVGKALQDPINGITALRRVGVNFTDDQKEVISKLVETGKVMEAQRLILKELNTEFGGSAVAAGQTFSGQLTILKNNFGELEEKIGGVLVKALNPFVAKMVNLVTEVNFEDWLEKVGSVTEKMVKFFFDDIPNAIKESISWIKNFIDVASRNEVVIAILDALKRAWDTIVMAIREELMPAINQLWETIKPFMPQIEEFGKIMAKVFGVILLGALLVVIQAFGGIVAIAASVLSVLIELADKIVKVFIKAWDDLTTKLAAVITFFNNIIDAVKRAKEAISGFGMSPGASLNPFSSSFQLPHYFASGGIVTGPTIAMVGEAGPEAIVPLNRAGGFGGISVNITGTFLSEDAAEKLTDIMIDRLKLQMRI